MLSRLMLFCIVLIISLRLNSMQPSILPNQGEIEQIIEQKIAAYKVSVSDEEKFKLCFTIGKLFQKQSEFAKNREQKIALLDQSIHWYSQIAEHSLIAKKTLGRVYRLKFVLIPRTNLKQSKFLMKQLMKCGKNIGYERVIRYSSEIIVTKEDCKRLLESRELSLKLDPAMQFAVAVSCLKKAKKYQEAELNHARTLLRLAAEKEYKPAQDFLRYIAREDLLCDIEKEYPSRDVEENIELLQRHKSNDSKAQTKGLDYELLLKNELLWRHKSDTLESQEVSAKLCTYCNKKIKGLFMCSICKEVYDCDNDWVRHKEKCPKAEPRCYGYQCTKALYSNTSESQDSDTLEAKVRPSSCHQS